MSSSNKKEGLLEMKKDLVLVVEDEVEIGDLVKDYLLSEGFEVLIATDGEEGIRLFHKSKPTLIVLDIMLPGLDGIEVLRMIRKESTAPVLMMTAKKSETDKIIGLGIGADDYITKPFSPRELVARIKAQLRRYKYYGDPSEGRHTLSFNELEIDEKGFTVMLAGEDVNLSAKEFQLLKFMATYPGQVFSKSQLYDQIWGYNHYGDLNTVTVYIRKIREKIEPDPAEPIYIKTVWGVGYKFDGSA
ncbi:response regulator transcription factor [Thalassorhabdus alkalitolerans]|uniref:Response regulator transcription factor n=1 Tax=Thalassorhabdus alkalitolerans TaxID=2282697 RepID=A0ABW0YJY8_9BACI